MDADKLAKNTPNAPMASFGVRSPCHRRTLLKGLCPLHIILPSTLTTLLGLIARKEPKTFQVCCIIAILYTDNTYKYVAGWVRI